MPQPKAEDFKSGHYPASPTVGVLLGKLENQRLAGYLI
jgi:hypothetical protein